MFVANSLRFSSLIFSMNSGDSVQSVGVTFSNSVPSGEKFSERNFRSVACNIRCWKPLATIWNLDKSLHHFYLVIFQSSFELSLCHSSLAYPQMFWSHWKVLTSAECARCPPLLDCRTLGGHMASHQTLPAPAPQQPPAPGGGSTLEPVWRPSQVSFISSVPV